MQDRPPLEFRRLVVFERYALVEARPRTGRFHQIRRHFEPELQTLGPTRRDDTVATIAALTSVESWEQFRRSRGRTPAQTRRAWNNAIRHILPLATGCGGASD